MRADTAVGGLGSGVALVWIWNSMIPRTVDVWVPGVAEAWPEMPAEVAVAVSPAIIALLDRLWPDA